MDLLVASRGAEPAEVLPALTRLNHAVTVVDYTAPLPPPAAADAGVDAAIVDARAHLAPAREFSRRAHAVRPDLPQLVVIERGGLVTLPHGWALSDFVVPDASPAEVQTRLCRAVATERVTVTDPPGEPALPCVLDEAASAVHVAGSTITLSDVEFRLLAALCSEPERVFSRADLVATAWAGLATPDPSSVSVHIARLRRRLGAHAGLIRTVRKVGYQLAASA